ncbi:hypothetical protein SUGI_1203760 [Cryptomeria japonica]|uniref:uncharacterized protein LOC131061295 n=1 Tax=Cryptomeria japonica TaxID=3369 RepID=UPI002414C44D|nr:uncharacterized protein LOC131061295 [Cryptomeria japonica]GLJ56072.1 hypothetical protein SUGI_1203760 [Cryptomeria japonica]
MEEEINLWMAQNRENAEKVGLEINMRNVNEDSIPVTVGGYMIMVSILSASEDTGSDGSFVAISLEEEHDDILMRALEALNDKLQRLSIGRNCLRNVLDKILQVFNELGCSKPNRLELGGENTEERIEESYVYRSAEAFTVDFETVLSMVDTSSIVSGILPWCSVKLIRGLEVVEVRMDIKHIIASDNVATALQFSLDDPLVFHVSFGSSTWVTKEAATQDFFRSAEVSVKESPNQIQKSKASMAKALNGMDEGFKNAIKESWSTRMRPYGPYVLLPDYIKGFLEHCYIRPDGFLGVRQKVAMSDNIFVALLIFVGSWLKTLRAFCAICKRPLPPFSRLWYCEAELCLYKFEELGTGASVLQELKTSELIDLELTLAAAATRCSNRDVFEPYPSFLLKKKEVRERAGFFSKEISGTKSRKYISRKADNGMNNKNLNLLQKLIDSFPPVSEIQQYSNEIELVVKLGISWLQEDCNTDSVNQTDLSQEDYAEKIWLPYKILRYVLFTNRLSLCLVQEDHRFNVHGSLYQFAVFYNSESELKFADRRKAEGSIFAFHGSSLSNWYSIIRNGLKCLSGTKYMSAGMAFGEGIYLSTEMDHSLSYSTSLVWKNKDYSVVALCEIFSGQNYIAPNKREYLVVPPKNENDIVIRYLIVFNKSKAAASEIGGMKTITTGHILSGDIDLYEHYEKLRFRHCEEVINGGLAGELLKVARHF